MKALALCLILAIPDDGDRVLEKAADAASWQDLGLAKEPKAKVERGPAGRFRIVYAGGRWPTVATSEIPEDWSPWKTLAAEVTVERDCLFGFEAVQE